MTRVLKSYLFGGGPVTAVVLPCSGSIVIFSHIAVKTRCATLLAISLASRCPGNHMDRYRNLSIRASSYRRHPNKRFGVRDANHG